MIPVVGLGRCGTSAMMGMLAAAEVPIFCDGDQVGNGWEASITISNPPADWLPRAIGSAVKVVAPRCFELPLQYNNRAILMTREAADQAASCVTAAREDGGLDLDAGILTRHCVDATKRLRERFRGALEVPFDLLIEQPFAVAAQICDYLGLVADQWAMARTVWRRPSHHDGIFRDRRNHHKELLACLGSH